MAAKKISNVFMKKFLCKITRKIFNEPVSINDSEEVFEYDYFQHFGVPSSRTTFHRELKGEIIRTISEDLDLYEQYVTEKSRDLFINDLIMGNDSELVKTLNKYPGFFIKNMEFKVFNEYDNTVFEKLSNFTVNVDEIDDINDNPTYNWVEMLFDKCNEDLIIEVLSSFFLTTKVRKDSLEKMLNYTNISTGNSFMHVLCKKKKFKIIDILLDEFSGMIDLKGGNKDGKISYELLIEDGVGVGDEVGMGEDSCGKYLRKFDEFDKKIDQVWGKFKAMERKVLKNLDTRLKVREKKRKRELEMKKKRITITKRRKKKKSAPIITKKRRKRRASEKTRKIRKKSKMFLANPEKFQLVFNPNSRAQEISPRVLDGIEVLISPSRKVLRNRLCFSGRLSKRKKKTPRVPFKVLKNSFVSDLDFDPDEVVKKEKKKGAKRARIEKNYREYTRMPEVGIAKRRFFSRGPRFLWSVKTNDFRKRRLRSRIVGSVDHQYVVKLYTTVLKNKKWISIYVECVNELGDDEEIQGSINVVLLNQICESSMSQQLDVAFSKTKKSLGWRCFVGRNKLLGKHFGFVFDDNTVCFELTFS